MKTLAQLCRIIRIQYRFEVEVLSVVSSLIGITMGVNVYFAIGSLVGLLSAIAP
jgi:hypothetical protein